MNKKEVLKLCPNYFKIINFEFDSDDVLASKIVDIYQEYVLESNIATEEDKELLSSVDKILNKYVDDYTFHNQLNREITQIRLNEKDNIIKEFIKSIIRIFDNYEEFTTRTIYISRWI